jgi:hypothetical protein
MKKKGHGSQDFAKGAWLCGVSGEAARRASIGSAILLLASVILAVRSKSYKTRYVTLLIPWPCNYVHWGLQFDTLFKGEAICLA